MDPRSPCFGSRALARGLSVFTFAFALVVSARAEAQVTGEQAVAAAESSKLKLPPDSFGGEASFGQLGDDFFVTLALRLNFDREDWGFGLQVPLRLRVWDRDPQNDNDFGGLIRREDWDEVSDFLRVLRYVYVGRADKKGPFYVRAGELSGLTIGHGTIMYRYYNGLDADVWHTGLNAAVNYDAYGAEAVIGDVVNPYLFGGRFTVRPLELAMGKGIFWDKLVVGASMIADVGAPYSLVRDAMGAVTLDEHRHPNIADRKALAIFGIDTGIELLSSELLSITPYIDLNKMSTVSSGWGLHMGILWGLRLPVAIDTFVLDARTEYRRVSHDYVGGYFDTAYEVERYQAVGTNGAGIPKLASVDTSTAAGKNGVFFDLTVGFPQFVFVGGEFVDYDGPENDGRLRLSLEIPALKVVQLSAFYYRTGISGMSDLFAIDNRSAIVAQAVIPMYSVLNLNLRWWRVWRAKQDCRVEQAMPGVPGGLVCTAAGEYETVDDWSVGVGFRLEI